MTSSVTMTKELVFKNTKELKERQPKELKVMKSCLDDSTKEYSKWSPKLYGVNNKLFTGGMT